MSWCKVSKLPGEGPVAPADVNVGSVTADTPIVLGYRECRSGSLKVSVSIKLLSN